MLLETTIRTAKLPFCGSLGEDKGEELVIKAMNKLRKMFAQNDSSSVDNSAESGGGGSVTNCRTVTVTAPAAIISLK